MPPTDRFVISFAAEPPQDSLPYGRWADTLREHFLAAVGEIDTEGEELGEAGEIKWFPDRTYAGRTYVPAVARTTAGPRAVRVRLVRRGRRTARRAHRFRGRRRLHGRARRGQPRLEARPQRRGDRRLARRGGQPAEMTLVWGVPMIAGRARRDRRARQPGRRPVRDRRGALHADRARQLPRRLHRGQAVGSSAATSWPPSRCTSTTTSSGCRAAAAPDERRRVFSRL